MKNHVSMEQQVCFACGKKFDTGAILMATKYHRNPRTNDIQPLKPLKPTTVTGIGMCPEHEDKIKEGYVILIGCDPSKSSPKDGHHTIDPDKAYRTGSLVYIRPELYKRLFNTDVPVNNVAFADQDVISFLEASMKPDDGPTKETPPDA